MAFPALASILKEKIFGDAKEKLGGKDLDIFVVNSFGSRESLGLVTCMRMPSASRSICMYRSALMSITQLRHSPQPLRPDVQASASGLSGSCFMGSLACKPADWAMYKTMRHAVLICSLMFDIRIACT